MTEQLCVERKIFEQNNEPNYMIFHTLEKRAHHRRNLARWPLHITVVPPFKLDNGLGGIDPLRDLLREIARDFRPFRLLAKEEVLYGPHNTVPATRVEDPSGTLHTLHERFLWDLGSIGCKEIDMTYAGENYSPHFTWTRGVFPPARQFDCDSLSVAMKRVDTKQLLDTQLLLD